MSLPDDLARPWGERLRTWREEIKGWSQEEFVNQVIAASYKMNEERGHDLGLRLVRRWERGETQRPQGVYRRILAHMGAPLPQVGARSALLLPSSASAAFDKHEDVDRRDLLKVGAAAAAAAGISVASEPWQRLEAALTGTHRPDFHVVEALELRTRTLFDLEENAPSQVVVDEVGAHLDAITNLLTATEDAQLRMRLIEQAGTAAALAGWLEFDRGSRETARRYYAVAERAAGQAGHSPLTACIRTYHSYLAEAEGSPAEAARYLQEALDALPRGRQPMMRAWLNARQAEEFAALGDRDNALRAFDRAYMAHDLGSAASEQPMWTRFFTATRLDGMAVAGYARLDHHHMEASAARLLGEVGDCRTKVEQIALADLAYAYLERGDVDRGAELAQRALTAINKSHTRVGYDRLAVVSRALAPYGSSRAAAGLREQLATAFRV